MFRIIILIMLLVLGSLASIGQSHAVTLWYNGDLNQQSVLPNGQYSGFVYALYDDFIVPSGEKWNVTTLFSNNEAVAAFFGDYEIRQGVSSGNGGTLIASGTNLPAVSIPTGRSFLGVAEVQIQIPVSLSLDPGTYWLMVRPVITGPGISDITATSGVNAVGTPPGNDGNAFWTSSTGSYFFPTTDINPNLRDFSMGVLGTSTSAPVPEPSTMLLLCSGLAGLIGFRKKFKK